jgi:hypothetical protein
MAGEGYARKSETSVSEQQPLKNFVYWTCSVTCFTEPYRVRVTEQVSQNAPHFAVFKRKLFKN